VSGTHSIVGATVGFALVAKGSQSIQWEVFGKIGKYLSIKIFEKKKTNLFSLGGSWFISPALAGGISIGFFIIIRILILERVILFFDHQEKENVRYFSSGGSYECWSSLVANILWCNDYDQCVLNHSFSSTKLN